MGYRVHTVWFSGDLMDLMNLPVIFKSIINGDTLRSLHKDKTMF